MNPTDDQIRAILYEFTHPERIQTSRLFKNVVFSIARGAKLHSIIEGLLTVIEDQQKELEDKPRHFTSSFTPTEINWDQLESLLERRTRKIDTPDHLNKTPITPEEAFKNVK